MMVRISPNRRVDCRANVELPMSSITAWGQLRDFQSSARHDPFHAKIEIKGDKPRAGAELKIEHRYLWYRSVRVGRILRWREGVGYSFSDLCQADSRAAFPHVLSYQLIPRSPNRCQLIIRLGGRWTNPLPRWTGRLWLWWVFTQVVQRTENKLLRFALARRMDRRYQEFQ